VAALRACVAVVATAAAANGLHAALALPNLFGASLLEVREAA
jgi:hypothetical protein